MNASRCSASDMLYYRNRNLCFPPKNNEKNEISAQFDLFPCARGESDDIIEFRTICLDKTNPSNFASSEEAEGG